MPGFLNLLCFKVKSENVPSVFIADMLIAADRYNFKDLKNIALDKLRAKRKIFSYEGFRMKLLENEKNSLLFDLFDEL